MLNSLCEFKCNHLLVTKYRVITDSHIMTILYTCLLFQYEAIEQMLQDLLNDSFDFAVCLLTDKKQNKTKKPQTLK